MTLEDLIAALEKIAKRDGADPDEDHHEADQLLLKYIGSASVTGAFDKIHKWYA